LPSFAAREGGGGTLRKAFEGQGSGAGWGSRGRANGREIRGVSIRFREPEPLSGLRSADKKGGRGTNTCATVRE